MFQSSIMSWSSKIIAVGTTEKNQRSTSGDHDSWYSQQYSSKSPTSSGGRPSTGACSRRSRSAREWRVTSRRRRPDRRASRRCAATGRSIDRACAGHGREGRRHRGRSGRAASRGSTAARAGRPCGTSRTAPAAGQRRTVRITLGGNGLSAEGQRRLAVDTDVVLRGRTRCETLDDHERVVVAGHGERAGTVPEHFHGARRVGLDPDRRPRRPDVAKHRSEDQVGHVIIRRCAVTAATPPRTGPLSRWCAGPPHLNQGCGE